MRACQQRQRLDRLCTVAVREAADGDTLRCGEVLLAPGDKHTRLRREDARITI